MNRPATLAAIALGFLTAFALGQLGLLTFDSSGGAPAVSEPIRREDPTVEAFYAGMNAWIATGDPGLESLLAPEFVDHTLSGAPDRNAVELLDYLSSLRSAVPALRFEILEIEASGSIVTVQLQSVQGPAPAIEGWAVELPPPQPFQEILRIKENRIAERWDADDLWPQAAISINRELPVGVETNRNPSIQRFILEPGRTFDLIGSGTVLVWVEAGELSVDLSGTDPSGTLRLPTESILPGELRVLAPEGRLHLRALDRKRVELWTVSLDSLLIPSGGTGSLAVSLPTGILQDALVSLSVPLPTGNVQLTATLITLPPGAVLSTDPAIMHAIAVVQGSLELDYSSGEVFFCFDRARSRLVTEAETALSGQGFANLRGGSASYWVDGPDPATLVLFAIHPAETAPHQPIRTGPN